LQFSRKHLLGLEGFSKEEILYILDTAKSFKEVLSRPIPKVPTLRGKTIVNLFFEASTRTRISFELAEKRLSADSVNFAVSTSSVKKGETLRDTARNIEAMKIDMVVMRHSAAGAPHFLSECVDAHIINAGDGQHEHPTQGLLDLMTLQEKFDDLSRLKVVVIGDIAHSRVARSNIYGLQALGAKVGLCGPSTFIPYQANHWGVEIFYKIEEAIEWADVLNVLRIQLERQQGGMFSTTREYFNLFGITRRRIAAAGKDITILHPGPINRGVEIESELADSDCALILQQVTNGVAIRMAVLYLFSGLPSANDSESET